MPFVEVVVAVEEVIDVSLSDDNSLISSYSESYTTETEQTVDYSILEDAPKKKRNYKPRKKKTDT